MIQQIKNKNRQLNSNLFWGMLYVVLMIGIMFACIFLSTRIIYAYKNEYFILNFFSLIIGVSLFIIIYYIIYLLKIKKKDSLMIILSIILTFLLFFLARNYSFKTGWDSKGIIESAQLIANNEYEVLESTYFSMYPNNIFITKLFSIAFRLAKLTRISDGYNYILLLNCCIYSWTGFFIYKIACYLFENSNIPFMAWIIYIFLIGLSPWVIVPYSDSLALGVVTLETFLFLSVIKNKERKKRIRYITLLLLISVFGYYIKPQNIIFLIAVGIITILAFIEKREYHNREKLKDTFLYFIIALVTIIMSIYIVNYFINNGGYNRNKEMKFGMSHFLMMGWNEQSGGLWNSEDVHFSLSFDNCNERNKANYQKFKMRIKNMKLKGVIKQIVKKTLTNYNDGTFAYGKEGYFYLEDYETGNKQLRGFLGNIYKEQGKYYGLFRQIMQILWITILFFNIFSYSKDEKIIVLQLSIIGLTLFEILFEARARYLFAYAPIYIILACMGFNNIVEFIKKKKINLNKCQLKKG